MNNEIEISIVMPCLNEKDTLRKCIQEAFSGLKTHNISGEIVVADNGSNDGSPELAESEGARVIHVQTKGYGSALMAGIEASRGEYILMGDSDGSYSFAEVDIFLEKLRQGYDLVMGCRFPKYGGKIETGAMPWKHRWIGNPILSGLGKLFFAAPVNDFHCGLRAFNKDTILALNLKTTGMEFASEMVMKATLNNLNIAEIPITLRPDGRPGRPHLRSWRDGWAHLRFMLLFSPDWLFIYPGIFLTLLGLLGFSLLLPAPLTIEDITFDLNSLLVSSMVLMSGLQICLFGILAKAYAINKGLFPGKRYWNKIVKGPTAEWGIAIGLILIVLGCYVLISTVLDWKAANFGDLSYQTSLRKVISSITGISLGIQSTFYGFVLNILGLEK